MNLALASFNCKQGSHYLKYLPRLPTCSPCFGQLWHTFREESEKLFAPRTRAAESMSNQAAFAICSTERYFSMRSLQRSAARIYSAGTASTAVCWQHERQHPPVNVRMPAAAVALTTRIPINMPSCFRRTLPILPPYKICIFLSYRQIKQYFWGSNAFFVLFSFYL